MRVLEAGHRTLSTSPTSARSALDAAQGSVPTDRPVLQVDSLTTLILRHGKEVPVVRNVSLELKAGEVLGILGESGSGKSMLALSIMGLLPEGVARVAGGSARLDGTDVLTLSPSQMRQRRGAEIAITFQEAGTALNPVRSIGAQLLESLMLQFPRPRARARALESLAEVGLPEPERIMTQFPFELSGGMRQRAMIALALTRDPKVLIADEPTTALDATVQAKVLRLLRHLCRSRGLALALITHDLGVVARTADRVAVMYAGEIVETLPARELANHCRMPYSRALIAARPSYDRTERLSAISGLPPDPAARPAGCAFHPRCEAAVSRCSDNAPSLESVSESHQVRCLRWRELTSIGEK